MQKGVIFLVLLISLITFVSALGVDIKTPTTVNGSTLNTNYSLNSGLLQGLTPSQVANLFTSPFLINQSTPFYNWLSGFVYNYNQTYSGSTYNITYQNKAGTGNCPAGQVVMNTTNSGVQCIAVSSSGDGGWQPNNLTETNNYVTAGNLSIHDLNVSGNIYGTELINISGVMSNISKYVVNIVGGSGSASITSGQLVTIMSGNGKPWTSDSASVGAGGTILIQSGTSGTIVDNVATGLLLQTNGGNLQFQSGGTGAVTTSSATVSSNGGGSLIFTGGNNGLITNTATTKGVSGGTGGAFTMTGGIGSNVDFYGTASSAGAGGYLNINGGAGGNIFPETGAKTGTGGNGGSVSFTSGAGGNSQPCGSIGCVVSGWDAPGQNFTSGNGGGITFTGQYGGTANAQKSGKVAGSMAIAGAGGSIQFTTTAGGGYASNGLQNNTAGNAGVITFTGGQGGGASGGAGTATNKGGAGTTITFQSGQGGTATGGLLNIPGIDGNILFKDAYNNQILFLNGSNNQQLVFGTGNISSLGGNFNFVNNLAGSQPYTITAWNSSGLGGMRALEYYTSTYIPDLTKGKEDLDKVMQMTNVKTNGVTDYNKILGGKYMQVSNPIYTFNKNTNETELTGYTNIMVGAVGIGEQTGKLLETIAYQQTEIDALTSGNIKLNEDISSLQSSNELLKKAICELNPKSEVCK